MENRKPYQQGYFPPVPTATTRFWRTNLLWQAWRLLRINMKMVRVIRASHH